MQSRYLVTQFKQMYNENVHANWSLETWKSPISGFFLLFWNHKRTLTPEINKNEVERARLVEEAKFPVLFVYGNIQLH